MTLVHQATHILNEEHLKPTPSFERFVTVQKDD